MCFANTRKPKQSQLTRKLRRGTKKKKKKKAFKFFVQFNIYATSLCAIVLGSCAYALRTQAADPQIFLDYFLIAGAVVSGFFGLFAAAISFNTLRFVLLNLSQVDALNRAKVYQLAVRVDRDTQTDSKFALVTYPPPPPPPQHQHQRQQYDAQWSSQTGMPRPYAYGPTFMPAPATSAPSDNGPSRAAARDMLTTRTFAILRTEPGENPWDLGWRRNWNSVMGSSVIDWILPVRKSPCTNHEREDSFYPVGPVIDRLRQRYGVKPISDDEKDVLELGNLRRIAAAATAANGRA